ncbi:hypothetical protein C1J00_42040 [Streptomyces cahuitamycinicus]|uniref:Uncharacterized protein n=1 Tax=Streptomyces cahuitamycinicus TaxID=2070367 RepID=A0A2N8TBL2_9ACTN|nr:hypothetical protein C1J00_42040 [Streptomyces cahuitamycinicus]
MLRPTAAEHPAPGPLTGCRSLGRGVGAGSGARSGVGEGSRDSETARGRPAALTEDPFPLLRQAATRLLGIPDSGPP